MTASRRAGQADALELLLDAVCNALGGILFVTLLLAVLLKLSSPRLELPEPTPADRQELAELTEALAQATAEEAMLQQAADLQAQSRSRLVDAQVEAVFAELAARRQQREELEAALLKAQQAAARTQMAIDALATAAQQRQQQLRDAQAELEVKRQLLYEEQQRRTRRHVPPHGRQSLKSEFPLILRYGRVYLKRRWEHGELAINWDDFVLIGREDRYTVLTPKPYRGTPIRDNPALAARLREMLRGVSREQFHVCLIVWDDSFVEFEEVKRLLVAWGYEIRILVIA